MPHTSPFLGHDVRNRPVPWAPQRHLLTRACTSSAQRVPAQFIMAKKNRQEGDGTTSGVMTAGNQGQLQSSNALPGVGSGTTLREACPPGQSRPVSQAICKGDEAERLRRARGEE
jgi:hypothetical protein